MYTYLLVITIAAFITFEDALGFIKPSESLLHLPVLLTLIFYMVPVTSSGDTDTPEDDWLAVRVSSSVSIARFLERRNPFGPVLQFFFPNNMEGLGGAVEAGSAFRIK
jgi:hypothetical protein